MADENKSMSPVSRIAIQVGAGALVGLTGSSVGGPSVISWWYEPPSRDAFSCAGSVKSALGQFVMMQLVCAAIGGIAVAVIFFFLTKKKTTSAGATSS
jgi:hypothetical protein